MTMTMTKPQRERISLKASMRDARVEREARIIRGFSVITEGEALGHGIWIDNHFLMQVLGAGTEAERGIKSRFTHPGLCSDGMGKFLGRADNIWLDGDIARADLNISDMADESPDGKLGTYVMGMAEKEPDMFGASIVFYHDSGAESRFRAEHEDEDGNFQSPDPRNKKSLPHARLAKLESVDIVDSPAANPGGFLSAGQEVAALGEVACRYIFGIDETVPPADIFGGLDPGRVRTFITQFLVRNKLAISGAQPSDFTGDHTMLGMGKDKTDKTDATAVQKPKTPLTELKETFPDDLEFVVDAFERGLSVVEAKAEYCDKMQEQVDAVKAESARLLDAAGDEIAKLKDENAQIKRELLGGAEAIDHDPEPQADLTTEAQIKEAKKRAEANGTTYKAEMSKLQDELAEKNKA